MRYSLFATFFLLVVSGCPPASAPQDEKPMADRFFEIFHSHRGVEERQLAFRAIVKQGASVTQYETILSRAHAKHDNEGQQTYIFYPGGMEPQENFDWSLHVVVDSKTNRIHDVRISVAKR